MALEKWDEESINALFRQYQETRDGVSFERYRPILHAARDMLDQEPATTFDAETEDQMATIRQAARQQYIAEDRSAVIDWAAKADRARVQGAGKEWIQEILGSIHEFMDSLTPARWVPIAVTAALLVAVVPFILNTQDDNGTNQIVASQIEVLQRNNVLISNELEQLDGFQMGFSSSASDFAAAFSAGVLFIDLVSLSADVGNPRLASIEEALKATTGTRIDLGLDVANENSASRASIIGDRLQKYYSNDSYSSVFILGQWVESNYLVSKIVQDNQNFSLLIKVMKDIDDMVALLSAGGYYNSMMAADFALLKELTNKEPMEIESIKKISLILLKMRSYLNAL